MNTSTGLKVVDIMCFATPVRSSNVTVLDLTGVAKHIISTTFRPVEVFIVAGTIYLLMTFLIHNFIKFLEKRYNYN